MLNLNMNGIEGIILSEGSLAAVFGINVKKIGYLRREKGLPCVYLTRESRVYIVAEVYEWLEKLSKV